MTSPKLEWRPIDTAPSSVGTRLMLSDGVRVEPCVVGGYGKRKSLHALDILAGFEPTSATYWMPFPPPPKAQPPGDI